MSGPSDFWERRKAAVRAEAEAERKQRELARRTEDQASAREKSDEELLAEMNLPDPDTLGPGDDFSGFLAKAVPERLRRRALRKLWLSNPVLANLDELLEYGEDYTDAATVVENLQTAYQVGKGMLEHIDRATDSVDAEERDTEQLAADVGGDAEDEPEVPDQDNAADEAVEGLPAHDFEEEATPVKRQMRFVFTEDGAK